MNNEQKEKIRKEILTKKNNDWKNLICSQLSDIQPNNGFDIGSYSYSQLKHNSLNYKLNRIQEVIVEDVLNYFIEIKK